ncbi:hypothetical protein KBC70_02920 [Candidatus Woesebacteria bacterium]|nr:hypothetical protein [Candidatus Woesebacteria bacterium]
MKELRLCVHYKKATTIPKNGEKGADIMTQMIGRMGKNILDQLHREVEAELTRLGYAENQDRTNIFWFKDCNGGRVIALPDTVVFYSGKPKSLKPLVPYYFSRAEIAKREPSFWEFLIPGRVGRKIRQEEAAAEQLRNEAESLRGLVWKSLQDIPMEGMSTLEIHWEDTDGILWRDCIVYGSSEEKELFNAGEFDDPRIESAQRHALEARCS